LSARKNLIFTQDWFCAGREEELASAGGSKVLEIAEESVLVERTLKHDLRAHFNGCRHRGARLCATAEDTQWNVLPLENRSLSNESDAVANQTGHRHRFSFAVLQARGC
jgi:hypothetical protein